MSGAAPKTAEKPSFAHNTLLLSVLSPTGKRRRFGATSTECHCIFTRASHAIIVRSCVSQVQPTRCRPGLQQPDGFTGRNVTLRRLVAEAWQCQLDQVFGPPWLDHNEYDIATRMPEGASKEQISLMLRSLLSERFRLKEHSDTLQMRVYELMIGQGGPRIHPIAPGSAVTGGSGVRFRGDMRHFADLLAVQFSIPAADSPNVPARAGGAPIPVLDKTGLQGIYGDLCSDGPGTLL